MSISRTSPPVWRQARTLKLLFWTGFGFAPLAALLLLVGDTGFPIKVALILGLGSVVLIGLSVVLRVDAGTVERDLYAALADSEAETKRALSELRGDVRRQLSGHEPPVKAVGSAPKPRELPYEPRQAEEARRPRPIQQGQQEYLPRQSSHPRQEERDPAYLPETTAVPRQRWEDEYPGYDGDRNDHGDRRNGGGRRGQAVEAWRADEPAAGDARSRRSRTVEDGWSDEVYNSGSQPRVSRVNGSDSGSQPRVSRANGSNSGSQPRASRVNGSNSGSQPRASRVDDSDPTGGRGRHYREPDELDGAIPSRRYREDDDPGGEIPARQANGSSRRGEYASGEKRSRNGNSSYMDTYYGDNRR